MSSEIALPAVGYKLYCWKVRNGSAVRIGETVALAIRKDPPGASTAANAPVDLGKDAATDADTVQHKRPTRKRRPGANPAVATDNPPKDPEDTSAPTANKETSKEQEQVPIVAQVDGIVRMGPRYSNNEGDNGNDIEVIGHIEVCLHATVVDGLCAVCGKASSSKNGSSSTSQSNNNSSQNGNNGTNDKMSRVTVSGLTVTVSDAEGRRMAEQDTERLRKQKKLSLVLDLDHTLVHATNDVRARQHLGRQDVRTLVLPMIEEPSPQQQNLFMQHFVKLRPYVKEFLESALLHFEIGVYTMGTRDYAQEICMLLARHMVGAKCDQVDLEHLRGRVAHLEFQVQRETQSNPSVVDTESTATGATTETNSSEATTETETEADTVPSPETKSNHTDNTMDMDTEAAQESSSDDKPQDETENHAEKNIGMDMESAPEISSDDKPQDATEKDAEEAGGKRKRVTFEELPPTTRQKTDHKTAAEQLEELQTILDEAERMEKLAYDLRYRMFGSRVVSRTDVVDLGRDVKSLKRIFPCGGTMAVVVDDREDVWANAGDANSARRGEPPENLLLVRPYHWGPFLGFADVNNASGDDLGETPKEPSEDSESDEQLLKIKDIISRVHTQYYSETNNEPNRRTVPELLRGIRHQLLAGTKMVLSGLVPLHKQKAAPGSALQPRPLFVRYAESMGAILLPAVKEGVTHVVAAKDGTDKTVAARKIRGCVVVKPSWLMDCVWSLRREPETRHLLGPVRPDQPDNGRADSKKEIASSTSSSDEDDDNDLAAAFENDMMEGEP
jgi:RNA polymerase II subunit A-like phosphatase